jgi:alkylation response protein AidB-like acyl-CoA dehydrogenase
MKNHGISEEARMIAQSASEFAQGAGGVARAREVRDAWPAFDQAVWKQIAELGWLAMAVPEADGGLGLDAPEVCTLLEHVGAVLFPEPLTSAIAAAALLAACETPAAAALLAEQIDGRRLWTLVAEPLAQTPFQRTLAHVPDCYAGTGLLIAHGNKDTFVIRALGTAAADIGAGKGDNIGANVGHNIAADVTIKAAACVDGSVLAQVTLGEAAWERAPVVGSGPRVHAAWKRALDLMLAGYAAYLVGLSDAALKMTVDYMKLRKQFGTPIGAFQALQHRAASCHVDILASRALVYEACRTFSSEARGRACAAAKGRASATAVRVTKECVQFHGAIGFADEHDIGLYLRKAMTFSARQGGEMRQKSRYAERRREDRHDVPNMETAIPK